MLQKHDGVSTDNQNESNPTSKRHLNMDIDHMTQCRKDDHKEDE